MPSKIDNIPDHFWDFIEDGDFEKFAERNQTMDNPYAAIADEIARAREDHLNSFGSSPVDVAKKRAALERLLRENIFSIIQALRIAAVSRI